MRWTGGGGAGVRWTGGGGERGTAEGLSGEPVLICLTKIMVTVHANHNHTENHLRLKFQ